MSPRRLAITSLLLVMVAAACSSGPSGSATPSGSGSLQPVRLLLGFRPDVQFAPFYLAIEDGYFADEGLQVSIEHSDDVLRLVADGQAQLGVADATDVIVGRTSGIPIKYVSTLYDHFPVALIGGTDAVPSVPAELAGLRIGTPGRFGSSWVALLAMLDAGGLKPDDVTIREYPAFNQVEGLLNGDVDLITGFRVNEPLQLEAQGRSVAMMTVDDYAPLPGPGLVTGDQTLANDRALVSAFARAVMRAQATIAGDVEAGLDAAIAQVPTMGEDRETARAVLAATVELWLDADGRVNSAIDEEVWRSGYQTMRHLGLIDGSVPLREMYDLLGERLD